jgi:hypothetical protein
VLFGGRGRASSAKPPDEENKYQRWELTARGLIIVDVEISHCVGALLLDGGAVVGTSGLFLSWKCSKILQTNDAAMSAIVMQERRTTTTSPQMNYSAKHECRDSETVKGN